MFQLLLRRLLLSRRSLLPFDDGGLRDGTRYTLGTGTNRGLNIGLNAFDPAHVHDANRSARWRCTLAYLLDFGRGERATGILGERRLLPVKRNGRGRRSRSRDDRPGQHVRGRTRGARSSVRPGSENALPLRRNGGRAEDLDRTKLSSRHRPSILRYTAASGESVLRNRRDTILNIPVHILDIGNRGVVPAGIVIVVDGGVIDDGVGVVDPREITPARLVGGKIRLTRTQGEPSHGRNRADGKA